MKRRGGGQSAWTGDQDSSKLEKEETDKQNTFELLAQGPGTPIALGSFLWGPVCSGERAGCIQVMTRCRSEEAPPMAYSSGRCQGLKSQVSQAKKQHQEKSESLTPSVALKGLVVLGTSSVRERADFSLGQTG